MVTDLALVPLLAVTAQVPAQLQQVATANSNNRADTELNSSNSQAATAASSSRADTVPLSNQFRPAVTEAPLRRAATDQLQLHQQPQLKAVTAALQPADTALNPTREVTAVLRLAQAREVTAVPRQAQAKADTAVLRPVLARVVTAVPQLAQAREDTAVPRQVTQDTVPRLLAQVTAQVLHQDTARTTHQSFQ